MGDHEIILGDCLAGMRALADGSVGCVITDAPYSAHVHASCRSGLTAANRTTADAKKGMFSKRKDLAFEHIEPEQIIAVAAEAARLAIRWLLFFSDVESAHLWREAAEVAGAEYVRTMAWVKFGGAPQFTGDRPAVGFEAITLAHAPGRKHWNGGGKQGVYSCSIVLGQRGEERIHTTQKPLELMTALVRDFTDPGELILDPFAGSGTTGVACKRLGRRFLGFERDPQFHAAAVKRLENTRQQMEFAPRPAKPKQHKLDLAGGAE